MNRILNFHEVNNYMWFNGLIKYLKTRYRMVSMDDLTDFYDGKVNLNNSCHITVDDGEKSFSEVIFPVLKKNDVPASLFVSPKILTERSNYWFQEISDYNPIELRRSIADVMSIGYDSLIKFDPVWTLKMLKIREIQEIIKRYQSFTNTPPKKCQNITIQSLTEYHKSGLITIGAHTINHPILKNEDETGSKQEIEDSVTELSDIVNCKIKYFAYPNGQRDMDFTEREEAILKKNGIELAVTLEQCNISLTDNKLRVPRLGVPEDQKMPVLKSKLLLGNHIKTIRKLHPNSEVKQRNILSQLNLTRNQNRPHVLDTSF